MPSPVTMEEIGHAVEAFRQGYETRLNELEDRLNRNATSLGTPGTRSRGAGGITDESRKSLHAWLRTGARDELSVGIDDAGGYLVTPDVESAIEEALREVSPLRRLITPRPISGDAHEEVFVVTGSVAAWVGELETRAEAAGPGFAVVRTELREISAMPIVTQRLLDMADMDVETLVKDDIGGVMGEDEAAAFVSGATTKKPRGFLTYPTSATADATRDFGEIEFMVTGHATEISADSVRQLTFKLHPKHRANARFLMSSATASTLSVLKDGNGRWLWQDGLEEGQPSKLVGYPVEISEDMPTIEAGAFPIAFANWPKAYRITEHRRGLRLLRDDLTTKGQVKFYATRLVGGGLRDSRAIKLLKVSA